MSSFRNYEDKDYQKMRRAVLKRDGYKCQMPGCPNNKKLHVHHILTWAGYPHLRYTVDNGIVLCRTCHKSIHGLENYYISIFTGIVNENTKRH